MGPVGSRVLILGTIAEASISIGWTGAVMDKTCTIRRAAFQVLLSALTVQALTPDALDLALMAHYRPPGPAIVLMSFFADDADDDKDASSRLTTWSPRPSWPRAPSSDQGESSDDEPADNIWQPLWPEIGLARSLPIQLRALPEAQSYSCGLIDAKAGRWLRRPGGPAVSGRDLSCSLCRIVC
jgi:hypothetical protein